KVSIAVRVPQADVDVRARSRVLLVPLRHEGERASLRPGDLLGGVLVEDVAVRLRQRLAKAEVDLLLAQPGLALAELDGNAALVEMAPDGADELVLLGTLEDVVVLVVRAHRPQAVIALRPRLGEAVVEDVE